MGLRAQFQYNREIHFFSRHFTTHVKILRALHNTLRDVAK